MSHGPTPAAPCPAGRRRPATGRAPGAADDSDVDDSSASNPGGVIVSGGRRRTVCRAPSPPSRTQMPDVTLDRHQRRRLQPGHRHRLPGHARLLRLHALPGRLPAGDERPHLGVSCSCPTTSATRPRWCSSPPTRPATPPTCCATTSTTTTPTSSGSPATSATIVKAADDDGRRDRGHGTSCRAAGTTSATAPR